MKRVLPSALVLGVMWVVCGSVSTAEAQWGYPGYGQVVAVPQPYVAYAVSVVPVAPVVYPAPYVYGGYGYVGYGPGPAAYRERYNYGLFGHLNYHQHARGPGYGHSHYHHRYPYGW